MFEHLYTGRMTAGRVSKSLVFLGLVLGAVFLLFVSRAAALDEAEVEDARLENAVKEQFFTSLNEAQITELLQQIDNEQNHSPNELGAKYRWGYIPPDRRIPDRLGEWWRQLGPAERRRHRVSWFRRYYQRLEPDQAAARLNLEERLYQIQRDIEAEWYRRDIELEEIDFEFEFDEDPPEEGEEPERTAPEIEVEREPLPAEEEPREEEVEKTEEPEPEEPDDKEEPAPAEEEVAVEEEPKEEEETAPDAEDAEVEEEPEAEEPSPFIYRRVGDEVRIIRRADEEPAAEAPETRPDDLSPARPATEEEPPAEEDEPVILDIPLPPLELSR